MLRGSNSNNESDTDYDENIYDGKQVFYNKPIVIVMEKVKTYHFKADAGLDHKIDDKGQLISFAQVSDFNNDSSSDIKETTSNNTEQ